MTDKPDPNPHTPVKTELFINVDPNSDSIGFVLAEDQPPEFIETSTRYKIKSELGRGGTAVVYKAHDADLNRDVAVKILRHDLVGNQKIVKRFQNEARIMSALQHPGIAQVYDLGLYKSNRPFYSMKLVDGETLFDMIQASLREPEIQARVLRAYSLVCQTMAYAHSFGIVHLDLKPSNIMVGAFDEIHVMDWGHSRRLDQIKKPKKSATKTTVTGTLEYMSPEQAQGQQPSKKFDVFALGGILYSIMTGQPLYNGRTKNEVYRMASTGELDHAFRAIEESGFDSSLRRLAIRCLKRELECANEVAREVARYQVSALQRYESDMTRFFELSLDLFCITGFDGFFRRINSNFSKILGYSDEELLSRPFFDFVHKEDQEKTKQQMSILFTGRPVVQFRNRYRAANGSYVHLEWTAKSIPDEGLIFAVARHISNP